MTIQSLRDGIGSEPAVPRRAAPLAAVLVVCMALAVIVVPALGALAPFLVPEFGLSRSQLGALTTAVFVVAVGSSLAAGRLVDALGGRRMLLALLGVVAVSLVLVSRAPAYAWLLALVGASGLAQALSNPATNAVISRSFSPNRRAAVTGIKQSGVPIGASVAGLLLPPAAVTLGWRTALLVAAALPVLAIVPLLQLVPADARRGRLRGQRRAEEPPPRGSQRLPRFLPGLAAYSLFLGGSLAAVSTYLPLYAHESLGFSVASAGRAVAVFGAAGVLGRLVWSQVVARFGGAWTMLVALVAAAAGFALLTGASGKGAAALVWLAAAGLGVTATAANAISMLLVVTRSDPDVAGRASARVSAGFFAGFVFSPPLFGALVDAFGGAYGAGWLLVAGQLTAATLIAVALHRTRPVS